MADHFARMVDGTGPGSSDRTLIAQADLVARRALPPRVPLLVDEAELARWLATARRGDLLEYHRGVLAIDRLFYAGRPGGEHRRQLDRVANILLALAQEGGGHVLQRRHGDGDYSYIFVMGRAVSPTGISP